MDDAWKSEQAVRARRERAWQNCRQGNHVLSPNRRDGFYRCVHCQKPFSDDEHQRALYLTAFQMMRGYPAF